jgi:hypothetical protein
MTRATRVLVAAIAATVVMLFAAIPALAHSDQGTMTAEARPAAAQPLAATARARVVFANDGHPANEAAVTVTGTGPNGAQVGPAALNRVDDGEYEANVALPAVGDWSLAFTSATPTASATTTVNVPAPATTTPPSTEPADQQRRASGSNDDDGSGLNASALALGGGTVVAAAIVGGVVVARRRR